MKTGALVLGIIGGLIALLYGFAGYALGSVGGSVVLKMLSVGLPVAALIGAGIVKANPSIGAALMGIVAIALVLILGFNLFTLIPVVLLGLGAFLGFLGLQEDMRKPAQGT